MTLSDKITEDLTTIRAAWLLMIPTGTKSQGGNAPVRGSKEPPAPAPIGALSLRREVCEVLASWCRVVMEDAVDVDGQRMRVSVSGGDARQMATWLLTWADFLATHEAGADAAAEIGKAARDCRAVAVPTVRDWMSLGQCPLQILDDTNNLTDCGGQVRAQLGDAAQKATCQGCGMDGSVEWWEDRMFDDPETRRNLTAPEVVLFVHRTFGKVITEAAVRQWVRRGVIESSGTDDKGRTVFNRDAVLYALDKRQRMEA